MYKLQNLPTFGDAPYNLVHGWSGVQVLWGAGEGAEVVETERKETKGRLCLSLQLPEKLQQGGSCTVFQEIEQEEITSVCTRDSLN